MLYDFSKIAFTDESVQIDNIFVSPFLPVLRDTCTVYHRIECNNVNGSGIIIMYPSVHFHHLGGGLASVLKNPDKCRSKLQV